MSYIRRYRKWFVLPVAVCLLALIPRSASAQRRRGPVVRSSVVVIGGYRYAPYWYYDPWFQWGPYGYPPPFGYPYYGQFDNTSSVRLEVTPRDAQVFVDGYVAGTVDELDGIFQRLRVRPGQPSGGNLSRGLPHRHSEPVPEPRWRSEDSPHDGAAASGGGVRSAAAGE